jgi:hypothetical protein
MSETTVTTGVHLCNFARPSIDCTTAETPSSPDGYPVLHIGPATIWPTVDQLVAIRAAIDAWLAGPDGIRLSDRPRPDAIC